jgi:hypothetical protein
LAGLILGRPVFLDQFSRQALNARVMGVEGEEVALKGAVGKGNHPERVDVLSPAGEI